MWPGPGTGQVPGAQSGSDSRPELPGLEPSRCRASCCGSGRSLSDMKCRSRAVKPAGSATDGPSGSPILSTSAFLEGEVGPKRAWESPFDARKSRMRLCPGCGSLPACIPGRRSVYRIDDPGGQADPTLAAFRRRAVVRQARTGSPSDSGTSGKPPVTRAAFRRRAVVRRARAGPLPDPGTSGKPPADVRTSPYPPRSAWRSDR